MAHGGPSRLTTSQRSLVVGAFFGGGRTIVGGPTVLVTLLVFLPFLTTVVNSVVRAGGGGCIANGGFGSGLTSRGFVSATLKGIGVGISGRGVSAFKATISSERMSTLSISASIADRWSWWIIRITSTRTIMWTLSLGGFSILIPAAA